MSSHEVLCRSVVPQTAILTAFHSLGPALLAKVQQIATRIQSTCVWHCSRVPLNDPSLQGQRVGRVSTSYYLLC